MSGAAEKQSPGAGAPAAAEKAAAGGDAGPEPPPPSMLSVDVTGLVSQFARSFVLIFPVYVLGYLGLSFSWVLIALCGLFWIRRHRGGKTSRLGRALAFLEDEEEAVRLSVSSADLPAWVSEGARGQHPSGASEAAPSPAGSAAVGRAGASAPPAGSGWLRAGREEVRGCRTRGARPAWCDVGRARGASLRPSIASPSPLARARRCPPARQQRRRRQAGLPLQSELQLGDRRALPADVVRSP